MSIAISSQMNSSLVSLASIADDTQRTQNRLATGLEIASASDNIAVYFKAKSYANKAEALDGTNKNISQAVANLDVVDKALVNMQENLKGAVSLMTDARSKAVTVTKTAITAGDMAYATATVGTGTTAKTVKGNIVQSGGLNSVSGSYFQVGDTFAIDLTDAKSGSKTTKYFKAADPAAATATQGDGSATKPMLFTDLDTLSSAIQSTFGTDTLTMNLKTTGTGTAQTFQLGFTMASTDQALSFYQTVDVPVGTTKDPGAAFDFVSLFGKQQAATATTYTETPTRSKLTVAGKTYEATTFASIGGAASNADAALQARLDAANFFRQTLAGLDNMVKDASLPGYANLLKGERMDVDLNDVGDVKQTIQLTQKGDPNSLGFVGYTVSGTGVVNTKDTVANFATDASIDNAINQSKSASALLKQIQTILASAKVSMNSRLDYNKTVASTLSQGSTTMTAADSTQEAANLASLQNRQSFAVNNMSITKQAESSLIQILR
jgi:flagellin